MRKITVSLTLALLLLSACAPKQNAVKTITVGLECNYTPFNWTTVSQLLLTFQSKSMKKVPVIVTATTSKSLRRSPMD